VGFPEGGGGLMALTLAGRGEFCRQSGRSYVITNSLARIQTHHLAFTKPSL